MIESIVEEFRTRVFNESLPRMERCLQMLSEEHVWLTPNSLIPPVGCQIKHACGNARQWVCSALGSYSDNRNRPYEFAITPEMKKQDLQDLIDALKRDLEQSLVAIQEEDLNRVYTIQVFEVSGLSALIHVIEHMSYHVGQITLLTKLWTAQSTGFYEGLDLSRTN